mmetsp:Transcript_18477/g.42773  ORF Transcript_18477/g.42773 Transcript_18477/m.42773 type:complete len:92 (-) Transcript_18477:1668-1943(-)
MKKKSDSLTDDRSCMDECSTSIGLCVVWRTAGRQTTPSEQGTGAAESPRTRAVGANHGMSSKMKMMLSSQGGGLCIMGNLRLNQNMNDTAI